MGQHDDITELSGGAEGDDFERITMGGRAADGDSTEMHDVESHTSINELEKVIWALEHEDDPRIRLRTILQLINPSEEKIYTNNLEALIQATSEITDSTQETRSLVLEASNFRDHLLYLKDNHQSWSAELLEKFYSEGNALVSDIESVTDEELKYLADVKKISQIFSNDTDCIISDLDNFLTYTNTQDQQHSPSGKVIGVLDENQESTQDDRNADKTTGKKETFFGAVTERAISIFEKQNRIILSGLYGFGAINIASIMPAFAPQFFGTYQQLSAFSDPTFIMVEGALLSFGCHTILKRQPNLLNTIRERGGKKVLDGFQAFGSSTVLGMGLSYLSLKSMGLFLSTNTLSAVSIPVTLGALVGGIGITMYRALKRMRELDRASSGKNNKE